VCKRMSEQCLLKRNIFAISIDFLQSDLLQ
jgi:hypothetical protein